MRLLLEFRLGHFFQIFQWSQTYFGGSFDPRLAPAVVLQLLALLHNLDIISFVEGQLFTALILWNEVV